MGMLEDIAAEIGVCQRCGLWRTRANTVPGEGPESARIMLIGEGPGAVEDRTGRPFVGRAGEFLNELLAHGGLRRDQVFIGNIIKCRPPDNRDPQPAEIEACRDYLLGQIAAINPQVICTLGRFAAHQLIEPSLSISREHGKHRSRGGVLYVPLYHPAAALHQQALRDTCLEDFRQLGSLLAEAAPTEPS